MDSLQIELIPLDDAIYAQSQLPVPSELTALQLSLIGGGIGDTQL